MKLNKILMEMIFKTFVNTQLTGAIRFLSTKCHFPPKMYSKTTKCFACIKFKIKLGNYFSNFYFWTKKSNKKTLKK